MHLCREDMYESLYNRFFLEQYPNKITIKRVMGFCDLPPLYAITFNDFLPVVTVKTGGIEYSQGSDLRVVTAFPLKNINTESGSLLLSSGARITLTGSLSLKPVFSSGEIIFISLTAASSLLLTAGG